MLVSVKSRSKGLKETKVNLSENSTLDQVLKEISTNNKNISKYRLRLTYAKDSKQVPIVDDAYFKGLDASTTELFVKDLGPQISWRLVFFIEYIGPIIIHTFFYKLAQNPSVQRNFSKGTYNESLVKLIYTLNTLHYTKRVLETLFLHKFSMATMPLFNLFKNSSHYWLINGSIAASYFGYGFLINDATLATIYKFLHLERTHTIVTLFLISEFWNFYVHLKLRMWGDYQKKLGNTTKRIPINEGLFNVFVAPNYTFEVWSWIWFAFASKLNIFSLIFLTVSATQMYLWAMKKNKKYHTRRAFLIPFIF
ncbi:Very-long-chain enoyl-CoA reductase [Nakaseomyces bracarensis]|uniref:Very-long-chain enoyl-CoA reductase n=1 Tax=Nakaseomyces bracarensis TaxID=273131 RepID=A0ABR4NWA0_9SACH